MINDLPVPCANCGRAVRPSQAVWTRQDDDAEPCCCKECYQQHEDEGCPMEFGGYRDNPKLLAAHSAEVERLTAERDAAVSRAERMLSAVCAWQIQCWTMTLHRARPSPWELAAKRCWEKSLDLFDENARLRAIIANSTKDTPRDA